MKHIAGVYDHLSTRAAVLTIVEKSGFVPHLLDGPPTNLLAQTRRLSPDVLVYDLAMAGDLGLGLVRAVRPVLPRCAVVPLAPFDGLRRYAVEAGAYDLVTKEDLRDLLRSLRRLAAELDATESALL